MTERYRARPQTARAQISNPVPGGQWHLTHLTILIRIRMEALLAQFRLYVHKSGLKPDAFHIFNHGEQWVCSISNHHKYLS